MCEEGPSALLVVVETRQRDTEYLVRFSRELDHLAREPQLLLELRAVVDALAAAVDARMAAAA